MSKLICFFLPFSKLRLAQFFSLLEYKKSTCVSQFFSSFLTDINTPHKRPYWDNFLLSFDPSRAPSMTLDINLQPDLIKKI